MGDWDVSMTHNVFHTVSCLSAETDSSSFPLLMAVMKECRHVYSRQTYSCLAAIVHNNESGVKQLGKDLRKFLTNQKSISALG